MAKRLRLLAGLATGFALCAPLLAADMASASLSFPSPLDGDRASRMAKACEVFKLRAATMMGRLETGLHLAQDQRPLYDQWRESVLSAIAEHEPACTELSAAPKKDLISHMEREERIYEHRTAALKAELPSLVALRTALSAKQKAILDQSIYQSRFARADAPTLHAVAAPEQTAAAVTP